MNLTLFFRLIVMSIFQSQVIYNKGIDYRNVNGQIEKMSFDNTLFFCPVVYANDGFKISLQIHNGNYAFSENGYRKLGHTWEEVEFGFPSENEKLLHKFSEMYNYGGYNEEGNELPFDSESFDCTQSVGRVPISVLEEIFEKRGGIDWEKTISIESYQRFIKS